FELKTVDLPESPDISPDGREIAFSALSGAIGDIFILDVETGHVRNLTNDQFGDFSPTWSPDGKSIIYLARVSGNDKMFRYDVATATKTQLTFGTHDDGGAQFVDGTRSQSADRPGSRPQREHLQHLDAQPENGRAEAVHRHADRQRVADRAEGRKRGHENRVRHLLQGGVRDSHPEPRPADQHRRERGFRLARPDHRFPGAVDPHPGQAERAEEG